VISRHVGVPKEFRWTPQTSSRGWRASERSPSIPGTLVQSTKLPTTSHIVRQIRERFLGVVSVTECIPMSLTSHSADLEFIEFVEFTPAPLIAECYRVRILQRSRFGSERQHLLTRNEMEAERASTMARPLRLVRSAHLDC
jgi:hypothetical protein